MLGLFAFNLQGIEGAILQMVNHGISTGALFLMVGVIYERRHTRLLADYGGLATAMPVYATLFVISMLSSVGLPGLNGFVGEFLILSGTFKTYPVYAVIAATGVILAAIYLLWLIQKVFYGPVTNEENTKVRDIAWNEIAAMVPLIIMMVWIGVYPNAFLKRMSPSVNELISVVKQEKQIHVMVTENGSGARRGAGEVQATITTPHPRFADPLPAAAGRGGSIERGMREALNREPSPRASGEKVAEGRMRGDASVNQQGGGR
jgi:NADH-quinone oxidoreductase subunit M